MFPQAPGRASTPKSPGERSAMPVLRGLAARVRGSSRAPRTSAARGSLGRFRPSARAYRARGHTRCETAASTGPVVAVTRQRPSRAGPAAAVSRTELARPMRRRSARRPPADPLVAVLAGPCRTRPGTRSPSIAQPGHVREHGQLEGAHARAAATRRVSAIAHDHAPRESSTPMSSLHEHLERHDLAVSPLGFRRDCPLCRAERVQGQLPSAWLVPPRACAAMTAAVLATSAVAPGAVAAADGQGVAAQAPAPPPPPQVSDVAVGGGGAAPVDGDHGVGQEPADTGDPGSETASGPSERAQETESGSGAVAPSGGGGSDPDATARPGGGSAGSRDAATVQPAPAAEPTGDSAPAGPDEPDRPVVTPGPGGAGAVACSVGYRPRDPEPKPSRCARERPGRRRQPLRRL